MMIKHIFYIPTTLMRIIQLILPRWLFTITYQPASEQERTRSIEIQNQLRLLRYKARS